MFLEYLRFSILRSQLASKRLLEPDTVVSTVATIISLLCCCIQVVKYSTCTFSLGALLVAWTKIQDFSKFQSVQDVHEDSFCFIYYFEHFLAKYCNLFHCIILNFYLANVALYFSEDVFRPWMSIRYPEMLRVYLFHSNYQIVYRLRNLPVYTWCMQFFPK